MVTTTLKKPTVGIAFTGNGFRGVANIALIELFEEQQFKPDLIIGCGGGAVVAGLWGQGLNAEAILNCIEHSFTENMLKSLDLYGFLSFFKTPMGHYKKNHAFLKPSRMQRAYKKLFRQNKLEDLQPQTLIQTTQVDSGAGVVFEEGLLSDLVYASGAMLPFLPPIHIGEHWYTDGNFSAPVPIMELVNRGMDHIMSLSFTAQTFEDPKSFLSYYSNFVNLAFSKAQRARIALAIELHHGESLLLPIKIDMLTNAFDKAEIHYILEAGRQAVKAHREEILRLIGSQ